MAKYDTVSKYLIQTYTGDIARFTLGREDVEVLELLDTAQPSPQTLRTDSLIRVRLDGREVLLHTEFQTNDSRPPMPRRMAAYIGYLIEHHGLWVCSTVVYLRPDAGLRDPGYYRQELPGHRFYFEYKVIRLIELEGQPVVEEGPAGLIPFAPLMKPPEKMAADSWLRQCVQAAREQRLERPARIDLISGLSILSGLVYASETISEIISKEGIMDIMRESSFGRLLAREWKKEGLEQGIEQGREQGIEQGREQGREQGFEQGGRKRAVEDLLDVLEIRFALGATHPLASRLAAIDDLYRLKQLHRAAVQVDSLEEFRHLAEAGEAED